MKNIIIKILIIFIALGAIIIGFKVGDNALSKANASTNNYICGTNNGWIWNGSMCVNTCDANHPWDPINKRCSTSFDYYTNSSTYNSNTNCAIAYGSNFYYDGKNCVEKIVKQNANYYSNPYNGDTTVPVYSNVNPYYSTSNYTYSHNTYYDYTNSYRPTYTETQNTNYSTSYPNINSKIIYQNTFETPYYSNIDDSIIRNFPRENADYYIYIITTTTSQPKGTPIYLGSNNKYNYYYDYYYWYSNTSWWGNYRY